MIINDNLVKKHLLISKYFSNKYTIYVQLNLYQAPRRACQISSYWTHS